MIHCYKLGGMNIVLDICSGSVHVVDEVAYDIIEMYERKEKEEIIEEILRKYPNRADVTRQDIEDCFADIEELCEAGLEVPQCAELIHKLRRAGISLDGDGISTPESCADLIEAQYTKLSK